jgi:hypothetical protein
MFAFKKFKIFGVLVLLNLMISSGHATDSSAAELYKDPSLDERIGRASSTFFSFAMSGAKGAFDLTTRVVGGTARLVADNPVPFVVAGACLAAPQVGALPVLPCCQGLINTLSQAATGASFWLFNSTIVPCLESKGLTCCKTPYTQESGPWALTVDGCKYLCDMLNPITLICPTPGSTFCREDPYTGANSKCWTTPLCRSTY